MRRFDRRGVAPERREAFVDETEGNVGVNAEDPIAKEEVRDL